MIASNELRLDERQLEDYCRQNHIRALAIVDARNGKGWDSMSEVCALAQFEEGHTPGYLGLGPIEDELSRLLGGRTVEINTPAAFDKADRRRLLAEATQSYGSF